MLMPMSMTLMHNHRDPSAFNQCLGQVASSAHPVSQAVSSLLIEAIHPKRNQNTGLLQCCNLAKATQDPTKLTLPQS